VGNQGVTIGSNVAAVSQRASIVSEVRAFPVEFLEPANLRFDRRERIDMLLDYLHRRAQARGHSCFILSLHEVTLLGIPERP
jgi:hypothetical protein